MLRANDLLLKDKEFKFNKMIESYEFRLMRMSEENKQFKEKYDKYIGLILLQILVLYASISLFLKKRIYEAQRKLEKLNNDLEEKLLRVVGIFG